LPELAGLALTDEDMLERSSADETSATNERATAKETEEMVRIMTRVLSVLPSMSGRLAVGCYKSTAPFVRITQRS
jgi:hypothetical protein